MDQTKKKNKRVLIIVIILAFGLTAITAGTILGIVAYSSYKTVKNGTKCEAVVVDERRIVNTRRENRHMTRSYYYKYTFEVTFPEEKKGERFTKGNSSYVESRLGETVTFYEYKGNRVLVW